MVLEADLPDALSGDAVAVADGLVCLSVGVAEEDVGDLGGVDFGFGAESSCSISLRSDRHAEFQQALLEGFDVGVVPCREFR